MKNNRSTVLRLLICILILLTPVTGAGRLFAQERKIQNRPYLDDRVWHYGFLVGVHVQDLAIMNNGLAYVNQEGGLEYCQDHLFTHVHVKEGEAPHMKAPGEQ